MAAYEAYVRERLTAFPGCPFPTAARDPAFALQRGRTMLGDFVREVRPVATPAFEVRFKTEPGQQAQLDFAHFKVVFDNEPEQDRVVWLFPLVLDRSRYLFARFCRHQVSPIGIKEPGMIGIKEPVPSGRRASRRG
jgi:transposase